MFPKTAPIFKLEEMFPKFQSQLEIDGEHLFWGIAREVLFTEENIGQLLSVLFSPNNLHVLWYGHMISYKLEQQYKSLKVSYILDE